MDDDLLFQVYNNVSDLDSDSPLPTHKDIMETMDHSVNMSKPASIGCFVILFYLVCYICFIIIKRIKRRDSFYDASVSTGYHDVSSGSRMDKDSLSQKRETFKKLARIICVSDVSFVTVFCATGICILVIRFVQH